MNGESSPIVLRMERNQYREGIIMVVLSITNPAFRKRAMQMSPDGFRAIVNISLAPES
jgi:hypothetical protein